MLSNEQVVIAAGMVLLMVALAAMGFLHERHYRSRAERIAATRDGGIEQRLATLSQQPNPPANGLSSAPAVNPVPRR